MELILVYEVPDVEMLPDNSRYRSIDLGVHNLMICYSTDGDNFIVGRKYFSIARKYDKEIARVQAQWDKVQTSAGVKYPKSSQHIKGIYAKKKNSLNDYLHKTTRWLADYCKKHDLHTVILGDMTGIRKNKDLGHVTNQKLHALPFKRIYELLSCKLALYGIALVAQNEAYSSQCSPLSPSVSKRYAIKSNRVMRGLYRDSGHIWNADTVGAYNIHRLYLNRSGMTYESMPALLNGNPYIAKVAV